jgi:hypothetical protein
VPYTPPTIRAVDYPPPQTEMTPRQLSSITDLIVHHSDGPTTQTAIDIDTEHREERGWAMIAYNYVIDQAGAIYAGRPDNYVPAATYGRNPESVNIVLIGDFQIDDAGYTGQPPAVQVAALQDLALYLHVKYSSIARTIGHRDVAPMFYPDDEDNYSTDCPGSELYKQLLAIKKYISGHLMVT